MSKDRPLDGWHGSALLS